MTGLFFGFILPIIVIAILCAVHLTREQKDKDYRRENNLPPRRYHDVTDYDVREVYTVHYNNDRH